MNQYSLLIKRNREHLTKKVQSIFEESDNKLVFSLQGQNLLESKNNCIESSTAIGYVVEEFIVSKLVNDGSKQFQIHRSEDATTKDSYDCFFSSDGIRFLVNIKAEKKGSANNAVAAIRQLYRDYCVVDPDTVKCYIVLKAKYCISNAVISNGAKQRCIEILGIDSYCIEQVSMEAKKGGFSQDNRRWKAGNNYNNGRLQITPSFRRNHLIEESRVSYENTKHIISGIFTFNEKREKE